MRAHSIFAYSFTCNVFPNMSPSTQEEKEIIEARVLQALSKTAFNCASLQHLTSGTTNFVYRGGLKRPLPAEFGDQPAATSVIVKHTKEHAALNKSLKIDLSRAV
jgi:hypothetical protein